MEKNLKVYWVVIIMVLTIATFIFIQFGCEDQDLVQYLSFAGSITSLVLGIVAIFYSIVSNQQSSENFGKLKEAVTKIEEGARIISDLSGNLNSKLDKISDGIDNIGRKGQGDQLVSSRTYTEERRVERSEDSDSPDVEN